LPNHAGATAEIQDALGDDVLPADVQVRAAEAADRPDGRIVDLVYCCLCKSGKPISSRCFR
jgi:hypothetical protein